MFTMPSGRDICHLAYTQLFFLILSLPCLIYPPAISLQESGEPLESKTPKWPISIFDCLLGIVFEHEFIIIYYFITIY